MRNCYIIVPGIHSSTKNNFDWFVRLAEDIMRKGARNPVALEYRYSTNALTRRAAQQRRARELADIIDKWQKFNIILVGHSNGCDLIQRALKITHAKVKTVHAFAGACENELKKTGFYDAFVYNRLGKLFVYASKNDRALKYAANISRLFNFIGMGYGLLGYRGATGIPKSFQDKVVNIFDNTLDHNDYFGKFYERTLNTILLEEIKDEIK